MGLQTFVPPLFGFFAPSHTSRCTAIPVHYAAFRFSVQGPANQLTKKCPVEQWTLSDVQELKLL
jgi:hypothetical protein